MVREDLRHLRCVDPVVQVEKDAYRRGYNRGTLECAVIVAFLIAVCAVFA